MDPFGLKGGALIPIRNAIKKNATGWDIISPILETGLAIPTSVVGILTFDYLNPTEAGVTNEDFLKEKVQRPNINDFNVQSVIDRLKVPANDTEIKPCE